MGAQLPKNIPLAGQASDRLAQRKAAEEALRRARAAKVGQGTAVGAPASSLYRQPPVFSRSIFERGLES